MSEKDLHNQFIAALKAVGLPHEHSRTDRRTTSTRGQPDFAVFYRGRVRFDEFKMKGNKLSQDQVLRRFELEGAGCSVNVWTGQEQLEEAVHDVAEWKRNIDAKQQREASSWLGREGKRLEAAKRRAWRGDARRAKPLNCEGIPLGSKKGKTDAPLRRGWHWHEM